MEAVLIYSAPANGVVARDTSSFTTRDGSGSTQALQPVMQSYELRRLKESTRSENRKRMHARTCNFEKNICTSTQENSENVVEHNLVFQQNLVLQQNKCLHCNFVEHLQYGNYDVEKYIIQETVYVGKPGESVYQHISNDQKAPRRM